MERIREAIERARSQQSEPDRGPRSVRSWPGRSATATAGTSSSPSADAEIHYKNTVVQELDREHLESHRIVAHQKSHPASWAFDLLRTQLLQKMDENGWRTVAITSPTMESGKTVVSINLAISIAQQTNRTALLIDFDLRRPQIARLLGLNRDCSLNQVLAGEAQIEDAMVNPGIPRLVVLPTQQSVPSSSEVLGSGKVAGLMSELRERYTDRVIVVDLPPVLAVDDVLAILPRVDCVLMVVGNGASTRKEIEEAMNRLSRFPLLGVVLNKDDAPSGSDYY